MANHEVPISEVRAIRFGEFELGLKPLVLTKCGQPVELPLQPLKLLTLLARRRGDLVTHAEMRTHLWGGRTVSFSNSVHVYISQIRAALGDDPNTPQFIENIPRQGYRFVAAVEESYQPAQTIDRSGRPPNPPNPRRAAAWACVAGLAAIFAVVLAVQYVEPETSPVESPATKNALDSYRRGIFLLEQRDSSANRKSLRYFDAALRADPELAKAHVAAARALGRLGNFEEANRRVRQALTLDDTLVDAYVVSGLIDLMHDWAWDAALRNFRAALLRDSENAQAHQGIAIYYVLTGELDAGIAHMEIAQALDPASTIVRADFGWFYYFAGDYDKAAGICRDALDLAPLEPDLRHCLIRSLWSLGEHGAAVQHMVTFMQHSDATPVELAAIQRENRPNALLAFDRWRLKYYQSKALDGPSMAAKLAFAAACIGEYDQALGYADIALEERNPMAPFMAVDPVFKPLETHPRFQKILETLGLRET